MTCHQVVENTKNLDSVGMIYYSKEMNDCIISLNKVHDRYDVDDQFRSVPNSVKYKQTHFNHK